MRTDYFSLFLALKFKKRKRLLTQSYRSLNYQDQENNRLRTVNGIQLMKASGVRLMTIPINILFTQHLVTPVPPPPPSPPCWCGGSPGPGIAVINDNDRSPALDRPLTQAHKQPVSIGRASEGVPG